jgi:hypothetical protein
LPQKAQKTQIKLHSLFVLFVPFVAEIIPWDYSEVSGFNNFGLCTSWALLQDIFRKGNRLCRLLLTTAWKSKMIPIETERLVVRNFKINDQGALQKIMVQ